MMGTNEEYVRALAEENASLREALEELALNLEGEVERLERYMKRIRHLLEG